MVCYFYSFLIKPFFSILDSIVNVDVTSANDNTVNNNMTTNVATTEYCDEYMSMLMMEGMEDEDPELAMALQFSLQDQSSNNNE